MEVEAGMCDRYRVGRVQLSSNSSYRVGAIGAGSTTELGHTIVWSGASDVPEDLTDANTNSTKYEIWR